MFWFTGKMGSLMNLLIDYRLLHLQLLKSWKSTPVVLGSQLLPASASSQNTTELKVAAHFKGPKIRMVGEVQNPQNHHHDFARSSYAPSSGFHTFPLSEQSPFHSPTLSGHLLYWGRETEITHFFQGLQHSFLPSPLRRVYQRGCLRWSLTRPYSLLKQGHPSLFWNTIGLCAREPIRHPCLLLNGKFTPHTCL